MKRYSEVVLNGHPDKFCDLVADRIILTANRCDPNTHAQIEVAVWSDVLFLTGAIVTQNKIDIDITKIIHQLGKEIGYTANNFIDVKQYKILDHICRVQQDPGLWTKYTNDQAIIIGYAGYDPLTRFLPPEHFLAWYFREKLIQSISSGTLKGNGPDGKILVMMVEDSSGWRIQKLLVTLQQKESEPFLVFTEKVLACLNASYQELQAVDERWNNDWSDIEVHINPNGPFIEAGSEGDNGQTGRKLVMDYYGPRIPIGGGALYGKDLTHIDRLGSKMARRFALDMVQSGAKDAIIKVCYMPGSPVPMSVDIQSDKKPSTDPYQFFNFENMLKAVRLEDMEYDLEGVGSFYGLQKF